MLAKTKAQAAPKAAKVVDPLDDVAPWTLP